MRYLTLFILVVGALLAINHYQEARKSAPKPRKPVVIYRTVPAPRSQVDANLDYLARVASHCGSCAMILVDILVRTIFAVGHFVPAAELFLFCDVGQVFQVDVSL